MDLRCDKTNCKHNCKYCCTAKKVHIAANTDCKTYDRDFKKNENNLQDVSKDMFEVAPDIAGFSHNDKLKVACHAKCVFNRNGFCNANGITILENNKVGFCGTFIEE